MIKQLITFYETKIFLKRWKKLCADDNFEELKIMQESLQENPKIGDIIANSGRLRKLRWSRPGMGKRGGIRVIYYYVDDRGIVALLTVYPKNEQENLSKDDIKILRSAIENLFG